MSPPNKSVSKVVTLADNCDAVDDLDKRLSIVEKDIERWRVRLDYVYSTTRLIGEKQLPELLTKLDKHIHTVNGKVDEARAEALQCQSMLRNLQKQEIEPLAGQVKEIGKQTKSIKPIQTAVFVQSLGLLATLIFTVLLLLRQ